MQEIAEKKKLKSLLLLEIRAVNFYDFFRKWSDIICHSSYDFEDILNLKTVLESLFQMLDILVLQF